MVFIEPLDLETILISKLAGTPLIFVILGVFVILIFAARFKMTVGLALGLTVFFLLGMWQTVGTRLDISGAALPFMVVSLIIMSVAWTIALRNMWGNE